MLAFGGRRNPEADEGKPAGSQIFLDTVGLLEGTKEKRQAPVYVVYNTKRYYGSGVSDLAKTFRDQVLGTPPSKFGAKITETAASIAASVRNTRSRATASFSATHSRIKTGLQTAKQGFTQRVRNTHSRIKTGFQTAKQNFTQRVRNTRTRARESLVEAKETAKTRLGYYGTMRAPRHAVNPRKGSAAAVAANLNPSAVSPLNAVPPARSNQGAQVAPAPQQ
jgi:hypothetical protein